MSLSSKLVDMRSCALMKEPIKQICKDLGKDKLVVVEVGVYRGQGTELFLESGIVEKIYSVDPWMSGYDSTDIASSTDMQLVENEFDSKFKNDKRVVKCKGCMTDFIDKFKDVDFVYIDANHQYESVKKDIKDALKLIRPSIAVGGHDYSECWTGVMKAVDEIVGKPDKTYTDSSWIKFLRSNQNAVESV